MAVITNPRWADNAQNNMRVTVDGIEMVISRHDPSESFRALFAKVVAGDHGSIGEYVPAEPVLFDPASMPRVETPIPVIEAPMEGATGPELYLPPNPNKIGWLEFLSLFTQPEQIAIANSGDEYVRYFLMVAQGLGGDMDMTDPRVSQGLDTLVAAGLIDNGRKARVLARQKPEE